MPEMDQVTDEYLEHYRVQCGYICPQRLPHDQRSQDIVVPLSEVFMSLTFGPESSEEVLADRELMGSDSDQRLLWRSGSDPGRLDTLLRQRRWSVVLGDPGSGKTTLLQWLALQHANAIANGEERVKVSPAVLGLPDGPEIDLGLARLPVFVSLGDYGETASTTEGKNGKPGKVTLGMLREFLPQHEVLGQKLPLEEDEVNALLERWLEAHRVILLLDGVDEVRSKEVAALVSERITEFCRDYVEDPVEPVAFDQRPADGLDNPWQPLRLSEPVDAGGSQAVVTSREGGYGRSPLRGPFAIVKTRELDDPEVKRFIGGWCHAVEAWQARTIEGRSPEDVGERAKQKSRELIEILDSHSSLRRVARNPLVLTVLSLLQREKGTVLPTRFALFEELTSVLVSRRAPEWTPSQILDVLGPLALWMQGEGFRTAHRDEVLDRLREAMEARVVTHDIDRHVEEFLTSAVEESGLLVETSLDYFGFFAHNVFREFFAAVELTRDAKGFVSWAIDQLDDPHWGEVLLLGIASIGEKHPTVVDEVLLAILEAPAGQSNGAPHTLMHGHALLAGAALMEMERGRPETIERIVLELVKAGSNRRQTLHRQPSQRIETALAELLEVRARQVAPILIDLLADDAHAPFICDALNRSRYASVELLAAINSACASSGFTSSAPRVRSRLVRLLKGRGVEVDFVYGQLGDLLGSVSNAFAEVPELIEFVRKNADVIDPPVYKFLHYLTDAKDVSKEQIVTRLLSLLAGAEGGTFGSLVVLARTVDEERVHAWVTQQIKLDEVDPHAAATYLATFSTEPVDVKQVPAAIVIEMLGLLSQNSLAATELAFSALEPGSETFDAAWSWLSRCAVHVGYIRTTGNAIDRVEELLAKHPTDRYGELLLANLRLDDEATKKLAPRLRELVRAGGGELAVGAALLLARRRSEPFTADHLRLIGTVLGAGDSPLRRFALEALPTPRDAEMVSDEVLELAHELAAELKETGDAAANFALRGVGNGLIHGDTDRIVAWAEAERPWAQHGWLLLDRVEAAIASLPALGEAVKVAVLETCVTTVAGSSKKVPLDPELVRRICEDSESSAARVLGAKLFAHTAVESGQPEAIPDFVSSLLGSDSLAAAEAIREASRLLVWGADISLASHLEELVAKLPMHDDAPWLEAATGLAVDAAQLGGPDEVLERLSARTAASSEAARALLHSVSVNENWNDPGGLEARIASVAECFASTPVGMRALVSACSKPLDHFDAVDWPSRRGACYLMYAAARRHPALFVVQAPKTLRGRLIRACRDSDSYSVRREAFALVTRLPPLDAQTVELVKEATRDSLAISYPIAWHLRHRQDAAQVREELVDEIQALLGESSDQTIHSAAVLLNELARRAPHDRTGQALRARVRAVLAARIDTDDPLLNIRKGRGILTLRETLEVLLLETNDASEPTLPSSLDLSAWSTNECPIELDNSLLEALPRVASHQSTSDAGELFTRPSGAPDLDRLDAEQLRLLNATAYMLLELRVGAAFASKLRQDFLDEFELILSLGRDEDARRFLEAARPDYQDLVRAEDRKIRDEVTQNWDEIVERLNSLSPTKDPSHKVLPSVG